MKKAAIIIPVFNRSEITLACLDRINKPDLLADIIIVDDASTDDTVLNIKQKHANVIIQNGTGDLFWTGGITLGMRYAYDEGAQVFIWMNDDTDMNVSDINELIRKSLLAEKIIWAPRAEDIYGEAISNGSIGRTAIKVSENEKKDVEILSGYCIVFSRHVIDKIGFPDANKYPHYAGDTCYSLLAQKAGFKLVIDGSYTVKVLERYNSLSLKEYIAGGGSKRSWEDVFQSIKSPFRLKTKKNLLLLKYGRLRGRCVYAMCYIYWMFIYGCSFLNFDARNKHA